MILIIFGFFGIILGRGQTQISCNFPQPFLRSFGPSGIPLPTLHTQNNRSDSTGGLGSRGMTWQRPSHSHTLSRCAVRLIMKGFVKACLAMLMAMVALSVVMPHVSTFTSAVTAQAHDLGGARGERAQGMEGHVASLQS